MMYVDLNEAEENLFEYAGKQYNESDHSIQVTDIVLSKKETKKEDSAQTSNNVDTEAEIWKQKYMELSSSLKSDKKEVKSV